ncbi:MAG: lipoprotein signal peptidase [Pseudomonadota bacterium]
MPLPKTATILVLLLLVLDQISKWWARAYLTTTEVVDILPVLGLVLAYNTGAAFSFLAGEGGWQRWFFVSLAIGVSVYLVIWLRQEKSSLIRLALSLILSGAIGNVIDRIVMGKVTDFILLHYQNFYWPVFNVADMAISAGAAIMLWSSFQSIKK